MQHLLLPIFRLAFIGIFTFGAFQAAAQTAVKVWDKAYGLPGVNEFNAAIQTGQGGFLIGATWAGTAEAFKNRSWRGGKDFSVFKVDGNGKPEWNRNFGSLYDENLTALCPSADGGFLIGGIAGRTDYSYHDTVRNVSHISENFRGKRDIWILKVDAKGTKQWDRLFGGDQKEELAALVALPDGYLLVGSSESGGSGDKSEKGRGNYDYWVIRTDLQGKKIWDKTLGGTGFDKAQAAVVTADGGFLIAGNSSSPAGGDKTQDSRTIKEGDYHALSMAAYKQHHYLGTDFWVVKLNGKGEKLWDRRYGGPGEDNLKALAQLKDGTLVLGGTSTSGPGGDKLTSQRTGRNFAGDAKDYWLVKIDANGSQIWEKTYGGNYIDEFASMLVTSDQQLLLAGHSSSPAGHDKSEDQQTSAVWLLKTDKDGNKLWDKQFTGLQHQYGERVAVMEPEKGNFVFAALSNTGILGDRSQPRPQMHANDSWLVKIEEKFQPLLYTGKIIPALCDNQTFEIPFTALGTFKPGNVFTAQLSNAKGSFRNPVTIGTLPHTGGTVNKITATLPPKLEAGQGYRVRVVASDPVTVGKDNGANFGIGKHAVRFVLAPGIQPEGGAPPYAFSLDGGAFTTQNFNEQLVHAKPGNHTLTVRDSRQCTASLTFRKSPDQRMNAPHTINSPGSTMVWHELPHNRIPRRGYQQVMLEYKFEGKPAQVDIYLNSALAASTKTGQALSGKLKFGLPLYEDEKQECVVVVRELKPRSTFTYSVKLSREEE